MHGFACYLSPIKHFSSHCISQLKIHLDNFNWFQSSFTKVTNYSNILILVLCFKFLIRPTAFKNTQKHSTTTVVCNSLWNTEISLQSWNNACFLANNKSKIFNSAWTTVWGSWVKVRAITWELMPLARLRCLTVTCRTAWDLDDVWLALVGSCVRSMLPCWSNSIICKHYSDT